jgi:mannitol-1-/sugar-/sorbitol-6-phosphatase
VTLRAFLFDLDGTLQDSEILWVAATRAYLADRGVALAEAEATRLVYGHSWRDVYAGMVRLAPDLAPPGMAAVGDALRPYYLRLRQTTDIRIPGSVALLRTLSRDYPVAIVSGATRHDVADSIEQMGVGDCVRFYLGAEDYGAGKPEPACYLLAAQRLALPPATCLVFEDSAAGVRAAKAAGMRCVALRRPGAPAQDLAAADEVAAGLEGFSPEAFIKRLSRTTQSGILLDR